MSLQWRSRLWDVKEPLRMTRPLAVSGVSASTGRSAKRKYSEKDILIQYMLDTTRHTVGWCVKSIINLHRAEQQDGFVTVL